MGDNEVVDSLLELGFVLFIKVRDFKYLTLSFFKLFRVERFMVSVSEDFIVVNHSSVIACLAETRFIGLI